MRLGMARQGLLGRGRASFVVGNMSRDPTHMGDHGDVKVKEV